jgi:hypothetical protein
MPGRSINNRQKDYLKTVHLEDIGSSKGSDAPVKLEPIEQALLDLAILFKVTAQDELSVKNAIDTNALAESIQFEKVKVSGGVYSVDINVLDYYKWVNKGVKGLKNKGINSPYSFRNYYVSKSFMQAIRKWVIRHSLKSNSKPARKHPLGAEKKRIKGDTSSAVAYAIALSIKKKGLKPTGFWDKAETTVADQQMEQALSNAFTISIINELVR